MDESDPAKAVVRQFPGINSHVVNDMFNNKKVKVEEPQPMINEEDFFIKIEEILHPKGENVN